MMGDLPVLTSILLCPVAGLVLVLLTPARVAHVVRWISAASALLASVLSMQLWRAYDTVEGGFQFVEIIPWVQEVGISYHLAVDGFSTILVMLNSIVFFTGVLTMWDLETRVKEFFAFMLLLVIGVYGVFLSQDLFFFFLFY
ncbi:MAG: NADH-quinone oxidoreductase subunit M, partial [bacterium]|nr:NADH-quinone oxidoreductase subunit M [bacterium]